MFFKKQTEDEIKLDLYRRSVDHYLKGLKKMPSMDELTKESEGFKRRIEIIRAKEDIQEQITASRITISHEGSKTRLNCPVFFIHINKKYKFEVRYENIKMWYEDMKDYTEKQERLKQ